MKLSSADSNSKEMRLMRTELEIRANNTARSASISSKALSVVAAA